MENIPVELLDFDLWKSGILLVVLKLVKDSRTGKEANSGSPN